MCIQKGKPFRKEECLLFLIDAHLFVFMGFQRVSAAKGHEADSVHCTEEKHCNLCLNNAKNCSCVGFRRTKLWSQCIK